MSDYYNPYTGAHFLDFIGQLFIRFWGYVTGSIGLNQIVADEIQILVLVGVAASSGLVGSFLVLRKMTMLANSLSHTILLGIVIAFLFTTTSFSDDEQSHLEINIQAMLIASLIMGILTSFLTELLTKVAKLQEDASIGVVFTSLFSLGIILVTLLTKNAHIGVEAVMGNVDSLVLHDCRLVYVILAINTVLFLLFFKEYKITTFDSGLARAFGFSPIFFNYLLMTQVSATTIGAFRAVGVLMVLAFMTGPVLTARMMTHSLKTMLVLSVIIGCLAAVFGVAISRHFLSAYDMPLSTAGLTVCMIAIIYLMVRLYLFAYLFYHQKDIKTE